MKTYPSIYYETFDTDGEKCSVCAFDTLEEAIEHAEQGGHKTIQQYGGSYTEFEKFEITKTVIVLPQYETNLHIELSSDRREGSQKFKAFDMGSEEIQKTPRLFPPFNGGIAQAYRVKHIGLINMPQIAVPQACPLRKLEQERLRHLLKWHCCYSM